jgi:excisionase family DNA binding protein
MFRDYPDIVSIQDICSMLNLGRNSVYRLLKDDEIRHVRVGKKYVIPKDSITAFVTGAWYNAPKSQGALTHILSLRQQAICRIIIREYGIIGMR